MRRHIVLVVMIVTVFLISACQPSDKAIQEAIAKTQKAQPTTTNTPIPTIEPTPTSTPDLATAIIEDKLEYFFPTDEEIAMKGYTTWRSEGEANEIELDTSTGNFGGVASYSIILKNSEPEATDEWAMCNITLYKTVNSARMQWLEFEDNFLENVTITEDLNLGESSFSFTTTDSNIRILSFIDKNSIVMVYTFSVTNLEIAETFARIIFEKLNVAKLVNPSEASFANFVYVEPTSEYLTTMKLYGFYLVGSEIQPGIWRNTGESDNCYWEITDSKGEIIDNYIGMTGGTMYIPSNAFQVQLEKECGDWEYLGEP